jgi:hypothetical protein
MGCNLLLLLRNFYSFLLPLQGLFNLYGFRTDWRTGMPQWTGKWPGGRTYVNKQGNTVWVLEKQVHGWLYTTRLAAGNENDALAERLQDFKQALNGWYDAEAGDVSAKRHRIAAIKAFYSWLREGRLCSPPPRTPRSRSKCHRPGPRRPWGQALLHASRRAHLRRHQRVGVEHHLMDVVGHGVPPVR